MVICLAKGQRVDLTKRNTELVSVNVGLGWDEKPKKTTSFLGALFGIDCDASVILLENDKYSDLIYFGKLKSSCKSILHTGDNLTGKGEGDDEVIKIDLPKVPQKYNKLVFVVNLFGCKLRKQDFGMIENAFIRIVNAVTNEELIRFNLTDNYQGDTSLIAGELYRESGEWKFAAIGEGTKDTNVRQLCARYK